MVLIDAVWRAESYHCGAFHILGVGGDEPGCLLLFVGRHGRVKFVSWVVVVNYCRVLEYFD